MGGEHRDDIHRRACSDLTSDHFFDLVPLLPHRQVSALQGEQESRRFFTLFFGNGSAAEVEVVWREQRYSATLQAVRRGGVVEGLQLHLSDPMREVFAAGSEEGMLVLRFLGQLYLMPLPVVALAGELSLPLPKRLYALHRRQEDRYAIPPCRAAVQRRRGKVGAAVAAELRQFSGRGLALRFAGSAAMAIDIQGQVQVEVSFGETTPVELCGEIAHRTPVEGGAFFDVGVHLEAEVPNPAWARLVAHLLRRLRPGVTAVAGEEDLAASLQLMQAPETAVSLRRREEAKGAWRQLAKGEEALQVTYLLKKSRAAQATVTATAAYPQTWSVHNLALAGNGFAALPPPLFRSLYDDLLWNRRSRYSCGLWLRDDRFLQRFFSDFARREQEQGLHHFEEVRILEIDTAQPARRRSRFSVRRMVAGEQAEVLATLRRQCSTVYLDALALRAGELRLRAVDKRFRRIGLRRKREILVARQGGRLLAFAVCDMSTLGRSWFGQFNQFRTYLTEAGAASETAPLLRSLLRGAAAFYHRQGVKVCFWHRPVAAAPLESLPEVQRELPAGHFWIFDHRRVKPFLRHLEQVRLEIDVLHQRQGEDCRDLLRSLDWPMPPFQPRRCVRLEHKDGLTSLRANLVLPSGQTMASAIRDLDSYGCKLTLPVGQAWLAQRPLRLQFSLDTSSSLEMMGLVRHQGMRLESHWMNCEAAVGVEFAGGQERQQALLQDYVYRRLNPAIAAFRPTDYQPLTELLRRANYFDYYQPSDARRLIESAESTYRQLPQLAPDLARVTLLHDGLQVIGSHAFYRSAPRTWHLHQLAVDPSAALYKNKLPTKLILQSSFQYLCLDPTAQFFLTYFHDQAPIAKVYFEAGRKHGRAADYQFLPFQMRLLQLSKLRPQSVPEEIVCREAELQEYPLLAAALRERLSALEFEALALDDPGLTAFLARWAERGLQRQRRVWVAHRRGEPPQACALVNLGPPGINIIGFHDNFRLFRLGASADCPPRLTAALLAQVGHFFHRQGRPQVYWEAEEGESAELCPWDFVDGGKNWRLVANRHCCMTALQFFLARYGRLEERLSGTA